MLVWNFNIYFFEGYSVIFFGCFRLVSNVFLRNVVCWIILIMFWLEEVEEILIV